MRPVARAFAGTPATGLKAASAETYSRRHCGCQVVGFPGPRISRPRVACGDLGQVKYSFTNVRPIRSGLIYDPFGRISSCSPNLDILDIKKPCLAARASQAGGLGELGAMRTSQELRHLPRFVKDVPCVESDEKLQIPRLRRAPGRNAIRSGLRTKASAAGQLNPAELSVSTQRTLLRDRTRLPVQVPNGFCQETDFFRLFARDDDDNFSVSELASDGSAVGV